MSYADGYVQGKDEGYKLGYSEGHYLGGRNCVECEADLYVTTPDPDRATVARLTAVADAARALKRPMGDWDPAWVALWKALAALKGDDRG